MAKCEAIFFEPEPWMDGEYVRVNFGCYGKTDLDNTRLGAFMVRAEYWPEFLESLLNGFNTMASETKHTAALWGFKKHLEHLGNLEK